MNARQIGPLNLGAKPYVRKKSQIVFVGAGYRLLLAATGSNQRPVNGPSRSLAAAASHTRRLGSERGIHRSVSRGDEEPAGKTCGLPRFHIMPRLRLLPCQAHRAHRPRSGRAGGDALRREGLRHVRDELQQGKAGVDETFALARLLGQRRSVVARQVEQPLEALRFLIGMHVDALAVLDQSPFEGCSSERSTTRTGISSNSASCAARKRRAPAMIS
jgi:hypothetical protein